MSDVVIEAKTALRIARLEDVAARARVAKSTASKVMSGSATVSVKPDTRERILAAARELGYHPDVRAQSLRLRRSHTLGVVVPELDNPAYGLIIRSAQKAAIERGYSLFISLADKDRLDTELYHRLIEGNRVDGVLVMTVNDPTLVMELRRRSVPYVLVNRIFDDRNDSIAADYCGGATLAVDHLTELGHRRIAYVSGPLDRYAGPVRLEGYKIGLSNAGLSYDPALVGECDYDWYEAGRVFDGLVTRAQPRPTAFCAANTIIASGIIAAARRRGLDVPGDVSVVALNDSLVPEMHVPSITAVQFPFEILGRSATEMLIDSIELQAPMGSKLLPPSGVIARQSSGGAVR